MDTSRYTQSLVFVTVLLSCVTGADVVQALAIADASSGVIRIFDGKGLATAIHTLDKTHAKPVRFIEVRMPTFLAGTREFLQYNAVLDVVVSVDVSGMIEYWMGPRGDYQFPNYLDWQYKTDTDLYEFLKVGANKMSFGERAMSCR